MRTGMYIVLIKDKDKKIKKYIKSVFFKTQRCYNVYWVLYISFHITIIQLRG